MEKQLPKRNNGVFYGLKVANKRLLTKNTFSLELQVPLELKSEFNYKSGQYLRIRYNHKDEIIENDYSITSASYEDNITLAIKMNSPEGHAAFLYESLNSGDVLEVSEPLGRFTLEEKPHEFRTILGFAGGIGITPIISHFKHILHTEPRTRLFLFYGNKSREEIAFREELDALAETHQHRLQIFYFLSREDSGDNLFNGRLDEKKLKLIINQILHLDDTDEESTIWDAVDEVLICGKGDMIKSLANACYDNGILKRNIHFELFEEFNEDIYPQEVELPLVENIQVDFRLFGQDYSTTLKNNKSKLLQELLMQKYPVPYSCKSGICGSCECKLIEGDVELLENEYLTEKEEKAGHILACMSVIMSEKIKVDFDLS